MTKNVLRCCFIPALLFFFYFESTAQKFEIINYEEKHSSGEVYSFPILKSATNAAVAKKINDKMQNDQLEGVIDPVKKGAFAKIWPEPNSFSGTTELGYEVLQNNDRYFSVKLIVMGCGAYCEGYESIYNFDSKTGVPIRPVDLFTKEGAAFVGQYIGSSRNKLINGTINNLTKASKTASGEDKENNSTAIEQYKDCKREESMIGPVGEEKLMINDSELTIIEERCFNHAMAALDEIGDFTYAIPVKDFSDCFNQYGNTILQTNKTANASFKSYKGTINNTIKISAFVEVPAQDKSVEGMYFYNRVAGLIKLKGKKTGSTLTFIETDDKGVKTGTFELMISGDALTGKWINPKTLKEMPVKLMKN